MRRTRIMCRARSRRAGPSGGKVVKVDRVEWITMPDAQTAVNALQSGDIDFMESVPFDLVTMLAANKDLKVETLDKLGFQTVGRMNFLYPPFDNVKVRRAAFLAMNQKDVLDALVGNPEYYKICGAVFGCDTPLASRRRLGVAGERQRHGGSEEAACRIRLRRHARRDHGARRCPGIQGAADRRGAVAA